MAKRRSRKKNKSQKFFIESPFFTYWTKTNYILLFTGIALLILGYYLMNIGPWDNPISLDISPIVLLLAYLIIFPAAILYRDKSKSKKEDAVSEG